jgi:hypothetical protein
MIMLLLSYIFSFNTQIGIKQAKMEKKIMKYKLKKKRKKKLKYYERCTLPTLLVHV